MKQVWKKRAVVAAVLLFTGAAVYLNWRYTDNVADTSKVLGQSTLVSAQEDSAGADSTSVADDYFATARLSRKQARDNAISMLKEAETDENGEYHKPTTAPEGNWVAYVDGQRAEVKLVGNVMVCLELTEGVHTIEFRYENKAFTYGALVSVGSAIAFGGIIGIKNSSFISSPSISRRFPCSY